MNFQELAYIALKSLEPYARRLDDAYENGDHSFRLRYGEEHENCKKVIAAIDAFENAETIKAKYLAENQHLFMLIAETPLVKVLEKSESIARKYAKQYPNSLDALCDLPLISATLSKVKTLSETIPGI